MNESPSSPSPHRQASRVGSIDWYHALPFLTIFGAVHAGLRPSRIGLAFVLLLAVVAMGRLWDGFSPPTFAPEGLFAGPLKEKTLVDSQDSVRSIVIPDLRPEDRSAASTASLAALSEMLESAAQSGTVPSLDASRYSTLARMIDAARPRSSFEAMNEAVRVSFYGLVGSVLRADVQSAIVAGKALFVGVPIACWNAAPWFTIYFTIGWWMVVGWGGGVLCRVSAGDLSSRHWSIAKASEFIKPRTSTLIIAPLFALALGFVLWVPAWILGFLGNLPLFDIVVGALFVIALAFGALSALVIFVALVGSPLIAPAVACDGCDAVESLQRAGAYMLARPLHLICYLILSVVVIALGTVAADFGATAMWAFARGAYDSASGEPALSAVGALRFLEPYNSPQPMILGMTQSATASFIDMWRTILCLLIGACAMSIAASCATRSYLLVRSSADGQDLCDLWEDAPRA